MMRFSPLYAPDGMISGGHYADRFDDGLVHNHHWAVKADEAYPSHSHGPAVAVDAGRNRVSYETSPFQSHVEPTRADDRHDDGLVHNHGWAASGGR